MGSESTPSLPSWLDILADACRRGLTDDQIREQYGAGDELATARRMAGARAYTPRDQAAVALRRRRARQMRRAGWPRQRIADALGVSLTSVCRYLMPGAGLPKVGLVRPDGSIAYPVQDAQRKAAQERAREAARMSDDGLSASEIASRLGVGRAVVMRYLRKLRPELGRAASVARRARVARQMAEAGASAREIADHLGVSRRMVYSYLRRSEG